MGLIVEETSNEELSATIEVVERGEGEYQEPWRFISLDIDWTERRTPKELRALGRWLMQQGRRLGREYKSNGAKKTST